MSWIKCANKMPENGYNMYQVYCKCVDQEWQMIVHYEDGEFFETIHDDNGRFVKKEVYNDVVTHWISLPEPPTNTD